MYGIEIPVRIETLTKQNAELLQGFSCGNGSIDSYFQQEAAEDATNVTYLFLDSGKSRVIACMTIACSAIFYSASSEDDLRPTEKFSSLTPAMEIVFFAVDESYQHIPYTKRSSFTLSQILFSYMIDRMRDISHTVIGAKVVVLYSVPEAVHFYERCSFKAFGDSMNGDVGYFVEGCTPMYYHLN